MIMGFWSLGQPVSHDHEMGEWAAAGPAAAVTVMIMGFWSLGQPHSHDHERGAAL
jgi:hypothetical protein